MTIIEDTRNKEGKHDNVKAYCERHGIELVRQKLDVGDYQTPDGKIAIDTKQNLDEVATNLLNRSHSDKSRFWREIRRAYEQKIKLIVLVEHGGSIKTINDVQSWRSKYSPATGIALIHEMIRAEMSYGVVWQFCDKRSTGKRIVELLTLDTSLNP